MKVICSQKSLVNGTQIAQKAITTKLGLPIFSGILFEVTKDNRIHLFSTDLEIGIDCYISAQIIEHGAVVIPSKIFVELIRKFPEGNIEIEADKDNIVHIKEEDLSNYKILGFSAEDFSPFPEIQSKIKIKLTNKILKDTIQEVIFASSRDENRSFLNGVLIKRQDLGLEVVATDSHRLALKKIKLSGKNKIEGDDQFEVIVPQRALSELYKLLSYEDDSIVEIDIGEKQVIFILNPEGEKNKIRLFSRIIEGQYPDYHQIIPRQFKTMVKIDTEELKQKMERIILFTKEDLNTIKMEVHPSSQLSGEHKGELILKATTPDIGDAWEQIPCIIEGEYIEIAFNSRYIVDVLRVIKQEYTEIKLNEHLSPAMISPVDQEEQYSYILMPVRMD